MQLYEKTFALSVTADCLLCGETLLNYLRQSLQTLLLPDEIPIRFVISSSSPTIFTCEIGILQTNDSSIQKAIPSIFEYQKRSYTREAQFNIALIIPTGIGANIGGHAGDAGPLSKLFGSICDQLITHPNVVNASDVNELPTNGLYVEGSILSRFLLGTIGLQPIRSNRILYLLEDPQDSKLINPYLNAFHAAQATYGVQCSQITAFTSSMRLLSRFSSSGRAVGAGEHLENFISYLFSLKKDFDAIAISTFIHMDDIIRESYKKNPDSIANPWGGAEAILTHIVSLLLSVPSAHAPLVHSNQINTNLVDARIAAEEISATFLQCILKGLHRAPQMVAFQDFEKAPGILCSHDISCLIIPQGSLGLPTLAALIQGIPVIEVAENTNTMSNDLRLLPWQPGQFFQTTTYLEAAGLACAFKAGITVESTRRPLITAPIHKIII